MTNLFQTDTPTRTMKVQYENWKERTVTVVEPDSTTPTYTIAVRTIRKPHMTFRNALGQEVGTANFHTLSSDIDTVVGKHELTMKMNSWRKGNYTYTSPAFAKSIITWESPNTTWRYYDLVCLDEQKMPLARFTTSTDWSTVKVGTLEILGERMATQEAMDEIAVTGLALAQYRFFVSRP